MKQSFTIVITGAGGGIGRALARIYAAPGVTIGLLGRNAARLAAVEVECRDRGADAHVLIADVRDRQSVTAMLGGYDARHPIDILIINAGISAATPADCPMESLQDAEAIMATNFVGALNCIHAVLDKMRARRHGQIALMGSLSAHFPLPASPAYCASKAALETYGASLRALLGRDGIGVSVISPGFVETDMSRKVAGPKPFIMKDAAAAGIIRRGLARNSASIAFPFILILGARLARVLPAALSAKIARQFAFFVRDAEAPENASDHEGV